ncbi:MAG: Histone family protein DNA-binding protein [uncultured bacterium]|nr:MAG: Histone family protein DNA-binding protein [uncultured bacterium]HBY74281.1 DNA-binding protein [Candidatus Kerfeldbacteria bacterium]
MAKPMTKSQFMAALADKAGLSKKQVVSMWEMLVDMIYKQTKDAGEVTLPGLGKMQKKHRAARMGRNPATGAQISIPAKTVLKFRVSKQAKDAIL